MLEAGPLKILAHGSNTLESEIEGHGSTLFYHMSLSECGQQFASLLKQQKAVVSCRLPVGRLCENLSPRTQATPAGDPKHGFQKHMHRGNLAV